MRWRVLTAVLIIGLILSGGFYCRSWVAQTCQQMESLLLLQKEQPDEKALENAIELWEASLPILSALLNHQQLESLGKELALASGALLAGDNALYLSQINTSLYLLDDIREYDYICWKTLF